MTPQADAPEVTDRAGEDTLSVTRRGVMERMADPYLTDHDRWVLRQFANFLSRLTPDPYLPSMAIGTQRPLPPRATRRTV